jgi:hypothetical protein
MFANIHFRHAYNMGVEDAIIAGLIICRHVDSDERYDIICRMLRISERIPLFWSVVDFMMKSLLPCVAYIKEPPWYHDSIRDCMFLKDDGIE